MQISDFTIGGQNVFVIAKWGITIGSEISVRDG